ncbi:MAG: 50S ribosomal protein L28 [Elusimicrobia bacterium]|nr:50S ribosomal protein L28 [Elusimicrobiota bacterium]
MSYKCVVCGKGPSAGKNVSHSKRATPRLFRPNLQKTKLGYVCTRCLRTQRKVERTGQK